VQRQVDYHSICMTKVPAACRVQASEICTGMSLSWRHDSAA